MEKKSVIILISRTNIQKIINNNCAERTNERKARASERGSENIEKIIEKNGRLECYSTNLWQNQKKKKQDTKK